MLGISPGHGGFQSQGMVSRHPPASQVLLSSSVVGAAGAGKDQMETSFYWQSCVFGRRDKQNPKILTQKGALLNPFGHRGHSKAVIVATLGKPHAINGVIRFISTPPNTAGEIQGRK